MVPIVAEPVRPSAGARAAARRRPTTAQRDAARVIAARLIGVDRGGHHRADDDEEEEDRDDPLMQRLSRSERDFVRGMKRKERTELEKLVVTRGKRGRAATAAAAAPAPLRIRVLQSGLPETVRVRIFDELTRNGSDKYLQWVERAARLPLGKRCPPIDPPRATVAECVARARGVMDANIAGHAVAKREVLKLVCQMRSGGADAPAYALGLEGAPGTGKTHFARAALGAALGRPLVTIPLGGATDISYLLGQMYTYEGSRQGRLAEALEESGCCNPILHFDEVDKISSTERGAEITSALLHIVDPSMNTHLRDRYFHGIDLDFSKCVFVFTYNDASKVSPILLDRIRRVAVPTPAREERMAIVRDHLVPRAQRRLHTSLQLSDAAIEVLLDGAAGGMRGVEKDLDHVLGCAQLEAASSEAGGDPAGGRVTAAFATEALGAAGRPLADGAAPPPPPLMYA